MDAPERITALIESLLNFAEARGLTEALDRPYYRNLLLDAMGLEAPAEGVNAGSEPVPETAAGLLSQLCDCAVTRGLIEDMQYARDLFSARLMGLLTPSPLAVRLAFAQRLEQEGAQAATDWFYQLCRDCDYIKVDAIRQNIRYFADSPAGELEITINLSKPEKDPKEIAKLKNAPSVGYPKCMLCVENPGYAGRPGFPARQNHRVIPLMLTGKPWYLQYSPYLYYNEHCIVFNHEHIPMKIDRGTFERLFDFVDRFPHYFLGSNADLPIVGGSILSHDHFQGGNHRFPMDDAPVRIPLTAPAAGVSAHVADWPMTCVVLEGADRAQLTELADAMLNKWRGWTDAACDICAETDGTPHNTITPIARRTETGYRLSLVLRNNRTSDEHPLGIFHPHADLHHVKKENIGLIEVMGLFILPGRLLSELDGLKAYLTGRRPIDDAPAADDPLAKHYDWVREIAGRHGANLSPEAADRALRQALAAKCARVLSDAGVYKQTPEGDAGIMRFLEALGYKRR